MTTIETAPAPPEEVTASNDSGSEQHTPQSDAVLLQSVANLVDRRAAELHELHPSTSTQMTEGAARLRHLAEVLPAGLLDGLRYRFMRAGFLATAQHVGINQYVAGATFGFEEPPTADLIDETIDLAMDGAKEGEDPPALSLILPGRDPRSTH